MMEEDIASHRRRVVEESPTGDELRRAIVDEWPWHRMDVRGRSAAQIMRQGGHQRRGQPVGPVSRLPAHQHTSRHERHWMSQLVHRVTGVHPDPIDANIPVLPAPPAWRRRDAASLARVHADYEARLAALFQPPSGTLEVPLSALPHQRARALFDLLLAARALQRRRHMETARFADLARQMEKEVEVRALAAPAHTHTSPAPLTHTPSSRAPPPVPARRRDGDAGPWDAA